MRAVVQRVSEARVTVEGKVTGEISRGLLVLLGVGTDDCESDVDYLVEKILHLRVFEDEEGKMNRSLLDIQGDLLVVSQFTLYGDCRRGRRPSYSSAARPETAKRLYELFVAKAKSYGLKVEEGVFAAHMMVGLVNDGPVTILLDSHKLF